MPFRVHSRLFFSVIAGPVFPSVVDNLTMSSPCPIAAKVRPSAVFMGSGLIDTKFINFGLSGVKWLLAPQSIIKSVVVDALCASWE